MFCLDLFCVVNMPRQSGKLERPNTPAGTPATGTIVRLLVGQAHGLIRVRNGQAIFFHRADPRDATTFNTLQVGDLVAFELIDDQLSGAHAIRVAPAHRRRLGT